MKTTTRQQTLITSALILASLLSAGAQTNTVTNTVPKKPSAITTRARAHPVVMMTPGEYIVYNIGKERAAVNATLAAAQKKSAEEMTILRLRKQAGKVGARESEASNTAIHRKLGDVSARCEKRLAELELKEIATRKSYRMDTTPTKPIKR